MLPRSKRKGKPGGCSPGFRPAEPIGYQSRTDAALKRERIQRLVDAIKPTIPPWASLPPWLAEPFLEGTAVVQRDLFEEVRE